MSFKALKQFDFVGRQPQINIFSNERMRSNFGGCITITSFIIIIMISVTYISVLFDPLEAKVFRDDIYKQFSPNINLTDKMLMYKLSDINGKLVNSSLAFIVPISVRTLNGQKTFNLLTDKPCNEYYDNKTNILNSSLIKFSLDDYRCLDTKSKEINVYDDKSKSETMELSLYAVRCNDTLLKKYSSELNQKCLPSTEIEKQLRDLNFFFYYFFETYEIDNYNQPEPFQKSIKQGKVKMTEDDFVFNYVNIRLVNYTIDNGLIFAKNKDHTFYKMDDFQEKVLIYDKKYSNYFNNTIGIVKFYASNDFFSYYKRYYRKLQDILSVIGGFAQVIFTSCQFLVRILTENVFIVKLFPFIDNLKIKKEHNLDPKYILNLDSKKMTNKNLKKKLDNSIGKSLEKQIEFHEFFFNMRKSKKIEPKYDLIKSILPRKLTNTDSEQVLKIKENQGNNNISQKRLQNNYSNQDSSLTIMNLDSKDKSHRRLIKKSKESFIDENINQKFKTLENEMKNKEDIDNINMSETWNRKIILTEKNNPEMNKYFINKSLKSDIDNSKKNEEDYRYVNNFCSFFYDKNYLEKSKDLNIVEMAVKNLDEAKQIQNKILDVKIPLEKKQYNYNQINLRNFDFYKKTSFYNILNYLICTFLKKNQRIITQIRNLESKFLKIFSVENFLQNHYLLRELIEEKNSIN